MKPFLFKAMLACMGLAGALGAAEITLPAETARLAESPLTGYNLALAHCHTCHSVDYIRVQPTGKSRTAWKASVVKMQKTFGAPIPDAALDPIAEYLVKTYGAERAAAGTRSSAPDAAKRK